MVTVAPIRCEKNIADTPGSVKNEENRLESTTSQTSQAEKPCDVKFPFRIKRVTDVTTLQDSYRKNRGVYVTHTCTRTHITCKRSVQSCDVCDIVDSKGKSDVTGVTDL